MGFNSAFEGLMLRYVYVSCIFIEKSVYLSHSDEACSNVISSDLNFEDVQFEFRQGH